MIENRSSEEGILQQIPHEKWPLRRETPTIQVLLLSSGGKIIADHVGRNRVNFIDFGSKNILFHSVSPSRKEVGIFGWLKNIIFFEQSKKIAEVNYQSWLGDPKFIVEDSEIKIESFTENDESVYRSKYFDMFICPKKYEAKFKVLHKKYLYPCIGFCHYFLSISWST